MADLYDRLAADIVNGAQESWVSALTRLAAESLAKACENPDEFRLLIFGIYQRHATMQ